MRCEKGSKCRKGREPCSFVGMWGVEGGTLPGRWTSAERVRQMPKVMAKGLVWQV